MFISVNFDLVSKDSEQRLIQILREYGFDKVLSHSYESLTIASSKLGNLKKDLAEQLDMDDKLRIYQYPLENKFKISVLAEKRWKRLSIEL